MIKNDKTKRKYVKRKILLKMWGKNEDIKGVELENKIGQQKSTCVACDSKTSTF